MDQYYPKVTRLFYRSHDANDSDSTMLKLQSRLQPTVKDMLKEIDSSSTSIGINYRFVQLLLLNQILILGLATLLWVVAVLTLVDETSRHNILHGGLFHWSGNTVPTTMVKDSSFFLWQTRLVEGLIGATLSIVMGICVDQSADRIFATTNFSTLCMVMTLFGRRSLPDATKTASVKNGNKLPFKTKSKLDRLQPSTKWYDVLWVSVILSLLTGCCEEIVFRGMLPNVLNDTIFNGNIVWTCITQAAIFGSGHMSRKVSLQENLVVGGLQFMNGLFYGVLYLASGGDLIPCIIAHALYDFQTLFFTWLSTNDQIEYAYYKSREPIPMDSVNEVKEMERHLMGYLTEQDFETCKRTFYIFDQDKNGAISLPEVQRGISYLAIEKALRAPPQGTIAALFDACIKMRANDDALVHKRDADELRYADFLKLLLSLKTTNTV